MRPNDDDPEGLEGTIWKELALGAALLALYFLLRSC